MVIVIVIVIVMVIVKVGKLREGDYIGEMNLLGLETTMFVRLQADPKQEPRHGKLIITISNMYYSYY